MPERHRPAVRRPFAAAALVVTALLSTLVVASAVSAQTTTTPPTTAAPVTTTTPTLPPTTTTTPVTSATTTAGTGTTTGGESDSSDSGLPWVPILAGVAILALIVIAAALLARRRGARKQELVDWRHRAADTVAEAGATARLLSTGTPPSGQIAQQIVASLRSFEEMADTAPDDRVAADFERARRNLQMLGLAIDSDYRLRREPSPDRAQLLQSQDAVRNAAAEADRTLRGIYRGLTTS